VQGVPGPPADACKGGERGVGRPCFGEREAEAEYRTHHLRQLRRHAVGLLLASAVCLGHALYATLPPAVCLEDGMGGRGR